MIGLGEKISDETLQILEIAAIGHDIDIRPAIAKHGSGSANTRNWKAPPAAGPLLESLGYPQRIIETAGYVVGRHHSYKNVDGLDYQILVEVDFLVNLFENKMSEDAILSTVNKIFRTETGREYCRLMFNGPF